MKVPNIKIILLSALVLVAATSLHATLLVNDNFDYGATDLESGYGSWYDGSSNLDYESTSNRLTSWAGDTDYVFGVAGGTLQAGVSNTWRGSQLGFGPTSGELWISALMLERTNAASDAGVLLALDNDGANDIDSFGGFGFGINGNGNLMTSPGGGSLSPAPSEVSGPIAIGSSYVLFVAKIVVNGGGSDDSISIWSFPNSAGDVFGLTESSLGTALYSSASVQFGDSVTGVWFGGYDNGPVGANGNLDNLRISNAIGDDGVAEVLTGVAVPEPSTYALLAGFGALALVMMRRRRRA